MKIESALIHATLALYLTSPVISDTNYGFAGEIFSNEADFEAFDQMSVGDRIILVNKNKWPECMIDSKLNNATECKAHIDAELEAMQLEVPIESVIIWTRTKDSPTSNAIVIPIDENNMCVGRSGNGYISYDWEWCSQGRDVLSDPNDIAASRKLLKPSKWTTEVAGTKQLQCYYYAYYPELREWHTNIHQYVGGDYENACSTREGMRKYEAARLFGSVVDDGCQMIPPIDCGGLSGVDACNMVKKHMVPYANTDGKNMECWLSYAKGSRKERLIERDLDRNNVDRRSTVKIYASWNSKRVTGVPVMTGPRKTLGSD